MSTVLKELLKSEKALSGEIIGQRLHISRAAVWKQINKIKERGIKIKSIKRKGYLVEALPNTVLIPEWIKTKSNKEFDFDILYYPEINSTNTEAKQQVLDGRKGNFLLITDRQISGRGRMDRVWESEAGKDLTFSLVIETQESIYKFYYYTMMMSLALQNALSAYDDDFLIKWPNDIYRKNQKIAGVLSEMLTESGRIRAIIIGVGINVNSHIKIENAVSLSSILGREIDRHALIVKILNVFHVYERLYIDRGETALFDEWKRHIAWLGERVIVLEGSKQTEGILEDLGGDGSLILKTRQGIQKFYTGDLSPSLRLKSSV